MKPDSISPATAMGFRQALLAHYDRAARDLPWRRDRDPYRILVSEFMLQQTRVETVVRYYGPWLERFPSLLALAEASEDEVLKAWEGLGYYRRARNLHQAARIIVESHSGSVPTDLEALRALPGVGEYTTGAVASIAFDVPTPAVDGNVRRVLARFFDEERPDPAWLRRVAREILSRDRPGDWNQALMELGATVCKPRSPRCDRCPVSRWCSAYALGTVDERPASPPRREIKKSVVTLAVFHCRGEVFLQRRPESGLLAGLWAFPESGHEIVSSYAVHLGLSPMGKPAALPPVEHRFTHLHVRYVPTMLEVDRDERVGGVGERGRWVGLDGLEELALPVAQRKVFESCLKHLK